MNNTYFFDKPNVKLVMSILICIIAAVLACNLILDKEDADCVPYVNRGGHVVFYEELGKNPSIETICATDQYIYYMLAPHNVIAVYDWEGKYIQSMAFSKEGNGVLLMGVEDSLLYIRDYDGNEFIFDGIRLLNVLSYDERLHSAGWYIDLPQPPLIIRKNTVYDESGHMIMELPGRIH